MYQPEFIIPKRITKTWGYQDILINGPDFCAKILHFSKHGNESGFEFHPEKRELFKVIAGAFNLRYKNEFGRDVDTEIGVGDVVYLKNCVPHQLKAIYSESEIFEVSTPEKEGDRVCIAPGDSQRNEEKIRSDYKEFSNKYLSAREESPADEDRPY